MAQYGTQLFQDWILWTYLPQSKSQFSESPHVADAEKERAAIMDFFAAQLARTGRGG
jgi:hypothetical protein